MVNIVTNSFTLHLRLMRILGFYPTQKYKFLYKLYSYCVFLFMTVPVPTLATVYLVTTENVTMAEISDSAFLICQVGCFIIKFLPFWRNPDKIRNNLYLLQQPLFSASNIHEEKILNTTIKICKRDCKINLTLVLTALVSWAVAPLLINKEALRLPIEIWLPYNIRSSETVFYFTYLFIVIGVANGAIGSGSIDPLIAGLACQGAAQLKILKNSLQYLNEYVDEEVKNFKDYFKNRQLRAQIMYQKIIVCIQRHNAIIEFIASYENTYSSVVFTQFLASVLVICNSCLQLSMVKPFTFKFFTMVVFLVTMLAEIFLYCYYGTILYDESNSVSDAVCMGNWYEYDKKSQQALIILMERCKRPIVVTAGKILDLSLVTFTTILRRAYSLLAVLKNY